MDSKLEKILAQKASAISNDEELLKLLRKIIADETAKTADEADADLIDEATRLYFSLCSSNGTDMEKPSPKAVEDPGESAEVPRQEGKKDMVSDTDAPFRKDEEKRRNTRFVKGLKRLAAAVAAMTVVLTAATAARTVRIVLWGMTAEEINSLERDKYLELDGKSQVILSDSHKMYLSLDELFCDYDDVLYLDKIPEDYRLDSALAINYSGDYDIIIRLISDAGGSIGIDISSSRGPIQRSPDAKQVTIGGRNTDYCAYDGRCQAQWEEENGCYYIVYAPSYEALENIITNLKEN